MDPIKIYWEEFPDNDTQIKEVANVHMSQQTGNVLNSTEVVLPQNLNYKRNSKQSLVKKKTVNINKSSSTMQQSRKEDIPPKTEVALKDLSASEKQKIAKLVHELAKFGDEKEAALKELQSAKSQYTANVKKLQTEKEQAVKKHDILKEKMLEYEILIDEIKQASKFTHFVECQKNTENKPPVIKEIKKDKENPTDDAEKKIFHDFSDLFVEQEKKFRLQQEQLQKQIDQVQKLQGSLIQQQSSGHDRSKQNETSTSEIGVNSKKLESYMSSEHSLMLEQSRVICETPLRQDTSYIPEPHNGSHNHSTANVHHSNTSLPVMRQTAATPLQCAMNMHVHTSLSARRQPAITPIRQTKRPTNTKVSSRIDSSQNFPSPNFMLESSEIRSVLSTNTTPVHMLESTERKNVPNVSAVQRKHFQPSSIIELVGGLQPRSTSTSVDQYSLQSRNSQTKPSFIHNKKTSSSTLKSVYGAKKTSSSKYVPTVDVDAVEKDILDDIFFI